MIPKVIHYCWFGHNKKPVLVEKCIASWHKFCPDYEIVEWNESNFDVNCISYVRDAYADKKWAFVSDCARLYIVYKMGGVYLDTDVLLHKSLDDLLGYNCWLASDDVRYLATGLGFGATRHHPVIGAAMMAYNDYVYPSGTNVIRDTKIFERELPEWKKSDKSQVLNDNILLVGMSDYGKWARHLYTFTWAEADVVKEREKKLLEKASLTRYETFCWKFKCLVRSPKLIAYFDKRRGTTAERIYTFLAYDLLDYGVIHFMKKFARKILNKVFGKNGK
jgi:hypothetical protein